MNVSKKNTLLAFGILIALMLCSYGVWRTFNVHTKELEILNSSEAENRFYKNPVGSITNIGDPYIFKASDGKYYCYPTSWNMGFKAWTSEDLVNWYDLGPVYKGYTSWASSDYWAPEVVEYKDKYYMYYTGRWAENKSLRIGVAVSDSPKGPFKDVYDHPMFDFGYAAIDANILIDDDGKKYMFYSRDCSENIVNGRHESHIYGIELSDDMLSVKGEPVLLAKPEQDWEKYSGEWRWNEGPTVFKHNDKYYMMYSANFYASKMYSVGYAVADSPLGTYAKYEKNPVLESELTWKHVSGPGHNSIVPSPDGSELFAVYHTHTDPKEGGGNRQVFIDRMGFRADGSLYVNGPTITNQPLPSGTSGIANLAKDARVSVSSTKDDFQPAALTDGAIGLYSKNKEYEWVSEESKEEAWVKLEWDNKQKVTDVLIYNSVAKDRKVKKCKLFFDNGYTVSSLEFPEESGAAAIVSFPEIETKRLRIELEGQGTAGESIGLSEIIVLGKKQ